ncbi:MAG: 3-deoxy-D-manno-octulosonic acid transferase [Ignavibacteriota bacterium]|nr:3-deoxy-D-manno-octulosonic acid transferase [Ignavibacteriota bacterium]MBW7842563.1 3-deoxy-D-manno-octulosonic acid transferase [Ignavibacterium sp.]MCO6448402.1 3-deoxy-D-manno-octulosonic acid transferase [Ignavibacterium album]MCZ2269616.1 3-deoxy-D-manno-octulosonic acid transferase [Ignavibacteriales bacterium]HOJ06695.1 glycosyltransferase N-terminal domain-containing protein [Ignavibacteriaceae bacterium]
MKVVFYIFYNLLLLPVLYSALRFAGIFNKKIRIGIIGRKRVYEELILNASAIDKNKKLVWFHSSSLGEFEQAKPIIEQLKKDKDVNVLITFFSPSGYINSNKYPHADLISYIPFDTKQNAKKFISITNPAIAIIMRYDLWPNIIETLNKRNIPAYLVDATLRENSPRSFPVIKSFHKILYNYLDKILTVSSKDAEEFRKFGIAENKIVIAGDTRFDRVYTRSLSAREKKLISDNIIDNKKVFVAGSTWEQDEEVIFPAFIKLAKFDEKVIMIVAPHEPTVIHLEKIENEFSGKLKTIRFSHLNNYTDEKVIIIDSIGILLTLYTYADVAFVGGSFKQNIHNVLEAAVYGTPVLFGPKIENSQEAIRLAEIGGGIIIKDKRAAYKNLRELFSKDELRTETGLISSEYVKANIGATQKILSMIYPAI